MIKYIDESMISDYCAIKVAGILATQSHSSTITHILSEFSREFFGFELEARGKYCARKNIVIISDRVEFVEYMNQHITWLEDSENECAMTTVKKLAILIKFLYPIMDQLETEISSSIKKSKKKKKE